MADGRDLTLIASGRMVEIALEAKKMLEAEGVSAGIVNARFIRPMDENKIRDLSKASSPVVILEDGIVSGGMGEEIMRKMREHGFEGRIELIGAPDAFIAHGTISEQTMDNHMDAESVCMRALAALGKGTKQRACTRG